MFYPWRRNSSTRYRWRQLITYNGRCWTKYKKQKKKHVSFGFWFFCTRVWCTRQSRTALYTVYENHTKTIILFLSKKTTVHICFQCYTVYKPESLTSQGYTICNNYYYYISVIRVPVTCRHVACIRRLFVRYVKSMFVYCTIRQVKWATVYA